MCRDLTNLALVIAGLCAGCATHSEGPESPPTAPYELLYLRSTTPFSHAIFLKPDPASAREQTQMLPLVMIESVSGIPLEFGRISGTELAPSDPVFYAVLLSSNDFLFFWFNRPRFPDSEWRLGGLRMALDAGGIPILWRVLQDSSGATPIYAAQSLEALALQNGLVPSPARRFALEPPLFEEPGLIVPALVSDHPAPMGPWLYLDPVSGDVTAVRCRCSPPQVGEIVAEGFYETAFWSRETHAAWESPRQLVDALDRELQRPFDWTAAKLRTVPAQ